MSVWVPRGGGHSAEHTDTGHISQKSKAGRKRYLCQRPRSSLYNKFCVAELTVTCVGGGQPFFQAALVHGAQCSCAVTRGKQSLPISTFMTDSTDGTVTTEADRQTEGNHSQTGRLGNFSPSTPPPATRFNYRLISLNRAQDLLSWKLRAPQVPYEASAVPPQLLP